LIIRLIDLLMCPNLLCCGDGGGGSEALRLAYLQQQGECTSGNVQLRWTRQLPPAARSREHSVSAAS
jgi:hypothetical protein